MIKFQGVCKSFGKGRTQVQALLDFDLDIPHGQMCALMGSSGSGKSTALHCAAGLLAPDSGRVEIAHGVITEMDDAALTMLRRREVGIIFQFFNLLPYLSAYENVALPLRLDGFPPDEENRRVTEVLETVGLSGRSDHKPHELSGGEMQRVAIARALAIRPSIILADEPTGNLDSTAGRSVLDLLREINENLKVTILAVTHDPIWGAYCDRIVRLEDGKISEDVALLDTPGIAPPKASPKSPPNLAS
ncbi:MAG: putative ABC transport system ATP-binding protein [Hyphomicrobiaceae bacterium]